MDSIAESGTLSNLSWTSATTLSTYTSPSFIVPAIWFCLAVASLLRTLCNRNKLKELEESAGTIYYLWAQPGNRLEAHKDAVPLLKESANDFRAIIRRFPSPNPRENIYDVSKYLDTLYAEFERSTNDDNDITCFQIVPDLIWPMAFRLGNLWFQRSKRIEFIELVSGGPSQEKKKIQWQWGDLEKKSNTLNSKGKSPATYIVDYYKSGPVRKKVQRLDATHVDKDGKIGVDLQSVSPGISRVKLVLCLTDADLTKIPFAKPDFKAGPVDGGSFEVIRIVAPFLPTCTDGEEDENSEQFVQKKIMKTKMCDVNDCDDASGNIMRIGGAELSKNVAYVIASTLDEFPDAMVELHARIPKTVALAAGLYITQVESSGKPEKDESKAVGKLGTEEGTAKPAKGWSAPTDFWTRLSLAFFDDASHKIFRIHSHELETPQ